MYTPIAHRDTAIRVGEITYALKGPAISYIYPQHRAEEPYNLLMAITMLCTVYSCMKREDVGPCKCLAFINLVPL